LATEDRQRPIVTYIESQGGSVLESLNIISTMNGIHSPVVTFCRGQIGGVAAVIAAHGLKGFRAADPGAHFSLRLQSDTTSNSPANRESYIRLLVQAFASDTVQPESKVLQWLTDGAELSAQQAMENGLIDAISRAPILPSVA
jgi:ATP-dependent Clp protease protease subunit